MCGKWVNTADKYCGTRRIPGRALTRRRDEVAELVFALQTWREIRGDQRPLTHGTTWRSSRSGTIDVT